MPLRHFYSSVLCISVLASCTTSPINFVKDQYKLTDLDVCRNYLSDRDDMKDYWLDKGDFSGERLSYLKAIESQVNRRNLTATKCKTIVSKQNAENWTTALMILGAAGAAGAAAYDQQDYNTYDYSTYSPSYNSNSASTGYAWDAFYDQYRNLVWRCRDKSNGQFASSYSCSGLPKNDNTWPSK